MDDHTFRMPPYRKMSGLSAKEVYSVKIFNVYTVQYIVYDEERIRPFVYFPTYTQYNIYTVFQQGLWLLHTQFVCNAERKLQASNSFKAVDSPHPAKISI